MPNKLPYTSKIVEYVIQYFYYKALNIHKSEYHLPPFEIAPESALDLLRASIDLGI